MSDVAESKVLLARYSKARIPFIAVNTIEQARTLEVLREIAEDLSLSFYVHTQSKGVYDLSSDKTISDEKTMYGALEYMTEQIKRKQFLTLILTEVPDLSTDNVDARQILALVTLAVESGGVIIVFTTNPIWNQLQRLGMNIQIDPPNEDEMYLIIKEYIDGYRNEIPIEWDNNDIREAASTLAGVTRIEAQNVIAALIANRSIQKKDMDEVRYAKDRMFSDISGLEKVDISGEVLTVGGLGGLKAWLQEKKELLSPEKRDQLKIRKLRPPRGILLVGVPGCGKSSSAKSIAESWKLPLYRLDFATVQGQFVGQSEQQLKDALATAERVSPCILWIDEIEKGLSGAGTQNDGGVSTRMVGQFLFWLQECKKQVFVVATANDVSLLPSELIRRGRFDELFFLDLPTDEERKEIILLYMKKYLNIRDFPEALANKLVERTEGFTSADLESSVRELAYRKVANENIALTEDLIVSTFDNVVPLSQTSPERIELIREWGRERAVPASGRPIGESRPIPQKSGTKPRRILVGGQ